MGSCLSKKTTNCSTPSALPDPPGQTKIDPQPLEKKKPQEDSVKKEIFVIKHRRSHEIDREEKPKSDLKPIVSASPATPEAPDLSKNAIGNSSLANGGLPNGGVVVRTSSCTKEEVDAILIQCGRLSRSSSTGKTNLSGSVDNDGSAQRGRKYSGSKRSYDFDNETSNSDKDKKTGNGFDDAIDGGDDETAADRIHRHRQRHRPSRPSSSGGRRRTPSRERDQQQQRSGSRERSGSGGGSGSRRVSRSPGRRSESPMPGANPSSANPTRPGKMVSVPATVSSIAMDKSNNGGVAEPPPAAATVKRIAVKRYVGDPANTGGRSAVSPRRSRSPARTNLRGGNENQIGQQPLSLSRSNSRKAEQSPYRRNPLGEIDQNCNGFEPTQQPINKSNNFQSQKPNVENARTTTKAAKGTPENKFGASMEPVSSNLAPENSKPQGITRSRSSRLSRDFDLNPPETLVNNPTPSSYTALLLEDIQNFHQKTTTPAVSLPACISKACSIVEAVADLNSSSGSSRSDYFNKKRLAKEPVVVESEMLVNDDLVEPSFHKYVTVRRGIAGGGEEEEESSGSNSIAAGSGQQYLGSSSTWEPKSADSTDRWTSGSRDSDKSPMQAFSEPCREFDSKRGTMEKKREPEHVGIGRNRVGYSRGLHSTTTTTLAAAST